MRNIALCELEETRRGNVLSDGVFPWFFLKSPVKMIKGKDIG